MALPPFLAVIVDNQLGRAVAEFRVHVVGPQGHRLQDVTVGIDPLVLPRHLSFSSV